MHSVESRGKHLLMVFRQDVPGQAPHSPDAGPTALGLALLPSDLLRHTHMRMGGSWHIYRPHERWRRAPGRAVVVVGVADMVAPCFEAPLVELLTARDPARHPLLRSVGPDIIAPDFDARQARAWILARPKLEIGMALVDQRAMAGVGNVYKSELVFLCRLWPFARVDQLAAEAVDRLIAGSQRLLRQNRGGGPRITGPALDPDERLWVYGRRGAPCRACGATVEVRRQGPDARSTYFCPACQTADGSPKG